MNRRRERGFLLFFSGKYLTLLEKDGAERPCFFGTSDFLRINARIKYGSV